jgi:hypothetical protein
MVSARSEEAGEEEREREDEALLLLGVRLCIGTYSLEAEEESDEAAEEGAEARVVMAMGAEDIVCVRMRV